MNHDRNTKTWKKEAQASRAKAESSGIVVHCIEDTRPCVYYKGDILIHAKSVMGFPDSSVGKESVCSAGDPSSIPRSRRSAGERIGYPFQYCWVSLVSQLVKNLSAMQETRVRSLGWEDPWRRERLPTPVFWPGEFHELYSPWGRKESDMTE